MKLEAGRYYKTRSGLKALVAWYSPYATGESKYPWVGLVMGANIVAWNNEGQVGDEPGCDDLIAEWKEPKRIKGWVAVYEDGFVSNLIATHEEAKTWPAYLAYSHKKPSKLIGIKEIDVEEGEGL